MGEHELIPIVEATCLQFMLSGPTPRKVLKILNSSITSEPQSMGSMCRSRVFFELGWPSDNLSATASGLTLKKMDHPSQELPSQNCGCKKSALNPFEDTSCESGC